jgi:hypothetical protein
VIQVFVGDCLVMWEEKQLDVESTARLGVCQSCSESKCVLQDRPIKDADIVVWHSFGVTHIPRIEDFPVMPVEMAGFLLKPFNFFDANPGLDIPKGRNMASIQVNADGACDDCAGSTPAAGAIAGTPVDVRSPEHSGRATEHTLVSSSYSKMPLSKI